MLYWPKLLVTAHAITYAVEIYIPLYLVVQLKIPILLAAGLIAITFFLRLFSGCWATFVDNRPQMYGVAIAGLATLSSFSFIPLLSMNHPTDAWSWFILVCCSIINGLFYQSLGILIDSAIIKILGDYRVLFYGSYIRWSKSIIMLSVAFIGWLVSVTDEKYLDTILVAVWVVGMIMTLFIAIVFTVVEPANSQDLNISEEQAPLLLKNALYLTADQTKFHLTYKPYSIFGEQLSHISEEEDASQLDRVFTTESIGRVTSYDSTPSYYSTPSTRLHHYSRHADLESSNMCVNSSALAALPLPASTDPLIALWTPKEDDVDYYTVTKRNKWKSQTLTLTLLLLGIAYGFINTFLIAYFYIMLDISIPILSVYIIMQILGDMVVLKVIEKWYIQRLNLTVVTTCAHIILILCAMMYPILQPNSIVTQFVLIILAIFQATAFQLMWLSGSYDVNDVSYNYHHHIQQQARLSAIYSSIGPALGVLLAGYFLRGDCTLKDYSLIFKVSVALFSSSFVLSWGWTSDD